MISFRRTWSFSKSKVMKCSLRDLRATLSCHLLIPLSKVAVAQKVIISFNSMMRKRRWCQVLQSNTRVICLRERRIHWPMPSRFLTSRVRSSLSCITWARSICPQYWSLSSRRLLRSGARSSGITLALNYRTARLTQMRPRLLWADWVRMMKAI